MRIRTEKSNPLQWISKNWQLATIIGVVAALVVFATIITSVTISNQSKKSINPTQENFDFIGYDSYANENKNLLASDNSIVRPAGSLRSYIQDNIDTRYTNFFQFEQYSGMDVKQTLVDRTKSSSNPTLDSIWFSSDSDAFITMLDNPCVLYDLDDSSEYAVGYVNTMAGKVTDFAFANNNYYGEELGDCVYDQATGLVYVPKYQASDKNVITTQMQLVCTVTPDSDYKMANSVNVQINTPYGEDINKDIVPNALDTELDIPVGQINNESIQVIANDEQDISDKCTYDEGVLKIMMSPVNLRSVSVFTTENNVLNSTLSGPESMNILPSDRFKLDDTKISPTVGACVETGDYIQYWEEWLGGSPSWYNSYLYGPNGFNAQGDMDSFKSAVWDGAGGVDLNTMSNPSTYVMMAMYTWNICNYTSTDGSRWDSPDCLPLKCGHIGTPVSSGPDNSQRSRILAINADQGYAVIGVCSKIQGRTNQGGCGTFKVAYESNGGVQMKKDSTCAWAKSNPNYSYVGAVYDIFSDAGCTNLVAQMTVGSDGRAATDIHALKKGQYYVRENQSVHGTNYLWNSEVGSVYVNPNTYNNVTWPTSGTATTYDTPADDPVTIQLGKTDAQTGETEIPEGYADFSNAHYEYTYYPSIFTKLEDAPTAHERQWVLKTDETGHVTMTDGDKLKVSGDEFYRNQWDQVICPVGTYVIREVKAPEGYEVSNITYIETVISDATKEYGATSKAYYAVDCDTWCENASGVMEKVHHSAGEEISLGTGEIIPDPQTGNPTLRAKEQVKKGDFSFDKQAEVAGQPKTRLTRIPFKVTSTTTGEWHVVVTDDNAEVNSVNDKCLHRTNENYFDQLLTADGQVPASGIDETIIDNFYNTTGNHAGVWFCWDTETKQHIAATEAADSLGAMPYDTYIIEELPVTKNNDYMMIKQEFTIDTNKYTVDLGTLTDEYKTDITIETTATSETGEKTVDVSDEIVINDRVRYAGTGIVPGDEYTLKSWMVNANCEKTVSDTIETKFTPDAQIGYVDVHVSLNTLELIGKRLYAYEELYDKDGTLVAQHKSVSDIYQGVTVKTPSISTSLVEFGTYSKIIENRSTDTELQDFIKYSDLSGGKEYKIEGQLIDKATGNVLASGNTTFISDDSGKGEASIYMTVDSTKLSDPASIVAYEKIYYNDKLMCQHCDITDANQTVKFKSPTCSTVFVSGLDGKKVVQRSANTPVVDTIAYDGFADGVEYTIDTSIVNKATGDVVYTQTSKQIASSLKKWDISFDINTLNLAEGTQLVCFEKVSLNGNVLLKHEDLADTAQTITVGSSTITTDIHIKDDASRTIPRSKSVSLVDDVYYYGLQDGSQYSIYGKLVNVDGSDYVDGNGNKITYDGKFTCDATGKTSIPYSLNTSNTADGTKIISVVTVSLGGSEICVHKDLADDKETVTVTTNVIDITTSARSYLNNDKEVYCVDDEGIVDGVSYIGAEGGYEYTLRARVINRLTKTAVQPLNTVEGKDYVEKKFLAKQSGFGTEDVTILLDTRQLQNVDLVVYEELYDHMGVCRATHEDINDYYQTVKTNQPLIETDLYQKSDNSQVLQRYAEQHLIDKISYKNLAVGHDYVFSGVLMTKNSTGAAEVYINEVTGLPVTATYTYRPSTKDGSFDKLEYVFDSTLLPKDKELVSYVTVTQAGGALIDHCVLDDERETVKVVTPTLKTKIYDPETGEMQFIACRDKVINDDLTWTDLPKNRVVQVYSWLVNSESGLPVTDGKITDDEALVVVSELVDALGGTMAQSDNVEHPSRYEVLFNKLTNKVDIEKLLKVYMEKLAHVSFTTVEVPISSASGTDIIASNFNYGITPAQSAVAMSVVVSENTVVAHHTDCDDKDETIKILRSNISTNLTDTEGKKEFGANERVMLVDGIKYENCIVGKEYVVRGSLVRKSDGSVIGSNEIRFICDSTNGTVNMSFQIETGEYAGCDIVAYEQLYLDGDPACEHCDINDEAQTIHINNLIEDVLKALGVKTGDDGFAVLLVILFAVFAGLIGVGTVRRHNIEKRRKEMEVSEMDSKSKDIQTVESGLNFQEIKSEVTEEEIDFAALSKE